MVRHAFSKAGGNLGESGCVAFMFDMKGVITVEKGMNFNADTFMLDVIEVGGEEMESYDDYVDVYTDPSNYKTVVNTLEQRGYSISDSEVTMIPKTTSSLKPKEKELMDALIEALEDIDDVQDIYHNLKADDSPFDQLS